MTTTTTADGGTAQSGPATDTNVTYAVEALTKYGRWEVWGVTEGRKSLNPCDTLEAAIEIKADLDEFRSTETTGYVDSRICEVAVSRRIVIPATRG